MKVTARIYAENVGDRWVAQFPVIDEDVCFPMGENGRRKAFPDECFKALASSEMVQGVKADEPYLNQLVASWVRLVNGWKDDASIDDDAVNYDRTMKRIERRIDGGRVTHATCRWSQRADGVYLAIQTDGHDIAEKKPWERIFAWKMAEAAQILNEDLAEAGNDLMLIRFDGETQKLLAEMEAWKAEREAERELKKMNEERFFCKHYCKGFCTTDADGNAPDFGCPCYSLGKCVDAKTIKEGKEVR